MIWSRPGCSRWPWAALALLIAVFAGALWLDLRAEPGPAPGERFDAIVVLGCRVLPSGRPSYALARRARHAARLYHAGHAPFVITTGGVGDFGPAEADVAAAVLLEEGVPERAILREDASTSTDENAAFARDRFGGRSVLVVSDSFHTLRARRVFARRYDHVEVAGTRSRLLDERRRGATREVLALSAYLVLGRIDLWLDAPRGPGPEPERGPRWLPRSPALDQVCAHSPMLHPDAAPLGALHGLFMRRGAGQARGSPRLQG